MPKGASRTDREVVSPGLSIYEQLWEELDNVMDELGVVQSLGAGVDTDRILRLQHYARGLAFGVALMGPWTYTRNVDAVREEAQRRWAERRQR